jgi:hypothetical protein
LKANLDGALIHAESLFFFELGLRLEVQELMKDHNILPDYMVERLGIPENMVGDLCNDLYSKYGTTMAGV